MTPAQEQLVQQQLASGQFADATEVVTMALRLLAVVPLEALAWLEATRQNLDIAAAELARGEGIVRHRCQSKK
ncbi:MAG: type II toxin-antitoxin system ParD family antitoxin [Spirulinaceae cyanobacterium SM2_1_0]|nr:type II toxin-antitoxin system ParD family antitoxin [Spirulinaceae cyanobacterium SM2_1_0]